MILRKTVWLNSFKNWHFLTFKVHFQCQNSTKSFRKWFSFLNMWIVEQLLSMTFYNFLWFWSTLFCKNVPNFWRLSIKPIFIRYQKSSSMFILGCKNLLNFAWNTVNFHNCLHATTQPLQWWRKFSDFTIFPNQSDTKITFRQ